MNGQMTSFRESGMRFGPYPVDCVCRIDHKEVYKEIQNRVKMTDFFLLHNNGKKPVLWIIEAKTSAPQEMPEFVAEIKEKWLNAISFGCALRLGRHSCAPELPQPFCKLDFSTLDIRFALVIKNHQKSWLPPLQNALNDALYPAIQMWAFSSNPVVVLNEKEAIRHHLVSEWPGNKILREKSGECHAENGD